MSHLIPCEGCARHVRSHEGACPFCGASIRGDHPAPTMPERGLGRAALFVFASTVALGSACQSTSDQGPTTRPVATETPPDNTAVAPMYGLPPGPPETADAGPPPAAVETPPMAIYGGPPPPQEVADAGAPTPSTRPSTPSRPPRRPGTIQVRYGAPPPPADSEWV